MHNFARARLPVAVPQFSLYGEQSQALGGEFVHIELIETRSRLHDWHIERHTHRGLFQVLFLLAGQVRASMDGVLQEHNGPLAITIHPTVVHGFDFSESAIGFVLTMDQQVLFGSADNGAELFSSLFVEPLAIGLDQSPDTCARIESLLENMIKESSWPHYGHTAMLSWLARAALLLLVRIHAENKVADRSEHGDFAVFTRFRTEVEQHFREQWQVQRYATVLRLTPTRLNRLCLRISGKSAFDITQDRLMLEACRKLTYAPSAIATVAYELGFQDPAYFSRYFKRRMGMSPKEFRQRPLFVPR